MTNDTYLPPKPTFAIENEIGMIVLLTFADVHLNLTEKFYFVEIWLFLNLVSRKNSDGNKKEFSGSSLLFQIIF